MAPWSGQKSRLLSAPISERGHGASAIAPETAGVTGDAHGLGDPESPRRRGRKWGSARRELWQGKAQRWVKGDHRQEGPQSGVKAPLPPRQGQEARKCEGKEGSSRWRVLNSVGKGWGQGIRGTGEE